MENLFQPLFYSKIARYVGFTRVCLCMFVRMCVVRMCVFQCVYVCVCVCVGGSVSSSFKCCGGSNSYSVCFTRMRYLVSTHVHIERPTPNLSNKVVFG